MKQKESQLSEEELIEIAQKSLEDLKENNVYIS